MVVMIIISSHHSFFLSSLVRDMSSKGKSKPNQSKQKPAAAAATKPPMKKKSSKAIAKVTSGGGVKKPHRFRPGTVAFRDAKALIVGARRLAPAIRPRPFQRLLSAVLADLAAESRIPGAQEVGTITGAARQRLYYEAHGFMHRLLLRYANSIHDNRQRLALHNILRVRRDDRIRAGETLRDVIPKHAAFKSSALFDKTTGQRTVQAKPKKTKTTVAATAAEPASPVPVSADEPTPVLPVAEAEEEGEAEAVED
jgi:hypothetical protein